MLSLILDVFPHVGHCKGHVMNVILAPNNPNTFYYVLHFNELLFPS